MLQAINLTKKYGALEALSALNLSVASGDVYCLLGANGAGKSTTINLFLNFIEPTSGEAKVNDLSVIEHPVKTKKYLAYIPENLILYPDLSGFENLAYFSGLANKSHDRKYLESLLERSGLQKEAIHRRVSGYSKGMRQKVGISISLAKEAKVLLLDEPTSGLDPKASNEFSDLLKDLSADGIAVLMATHDLFRAQDTGSHIGIMKRGRLLESFNANEISLQALEKRYLEMMAD